MVHKALSNHVFDFLLDISEVNDNLRGDNFDSLGAVRTMLEFRRKLYRDFINNPYLIQDDLTPEERKSKIIKHNDGHIIIKQPRGGKSTATELLNQNQNIPLTNLNLGFKY